MYGRGQIENATNDANKPTIRLNNGDCYCVLVGTLVRNANSSGEVLTQVASTTHSKWINVIWSDGLPPNIDSNDDVSGNCAWVQRYGVEDGYTGRHSAVFQFAGTALTSNNIVFPGGLNWPSTARVTGWAYYNSSTPANSADFNIYWTFSGVNLTATRGVGGGAVTSGLAGRVVIEWKA